MGIFEKLGEDEEFTLTGLHLNGNSTLEEKIKTVRKNCGWDLKVSPDVKEMNPPKVEELAMIGVLIRKAFTDKGNLSFLPQTRQTKTDELLCAD